MKYCLHKILLIVLVTKLSIGFSSGYLMTNREGHVGLNETGHSFQAKNPMNLLDSCMCLTSEMILTQDIFDFALSCIPHDGSNPVIKCEDGEVRISGFFGCVDQVSGEPCQKETSVDWLLIDPNGNIIDQGGATNYPSLTFPPAYFPYSGTYQLTFTTFCNGLKEPCICILDWIVDCDNCCTDSTTFSYLLENEVAFSLDSCTAKVTIGNLPDCDYIEIINWGDGNESVGPFYAFDTIIHAYAESGSYIFSYLGIESDPDTGETCYTRTFSDTINSVCQVPCCGPWFDSNGHGIINFTSFIGNTNKISCGGVENVKCLKGGTITLNGNYQCVACVLGQINWEISHPLLGIVDVGTVIPTPGFTILLPAGYFSAAGLYTVKLTANCSNLSCPCTFYINVTDPCPALCPCDVKDLLADVSKGFLVATNTFNKCQKCFIPQALTSCDQVVWKITPGTFTAFTTGNQWMCYTFPASGTYNISMEVFRKKALNSFCGMSKYNKKITVSCGPIGPFCPSPKILNPGFGDGANPGVLGEGGSSDHWINLSGTPQVDTTASSEDGYVITLSGNKGQFDAIMSGQNICIDKESTALQVIIQSVDANGAHTKPPRFQERAVVRFVRDDNYLPSECVPPNCYEIATINLQEGLTHSQLIEIPIDLSMFMADDSCSIEPSLYVRPVIFVTNDHGAEMNSDSVSYVQLDLFCLQELIVATVDPDPSLSLQIYPNPNDGVFTVVMPEPAQQGLLLQVIGLSGNVILTTKTISGSVIQTVDATYLSQGMYLLRAVSDGRVLFLDKFIKQ